MPRGGRQEQHQPTKENRKVVWILRSVGTPYKDIARALGITMPTLRKYYRDELDSAQIEAKAKVVASLYRKAVQGNVSAIKYWLGNQEGWTTKQELTGPEGGPIQYQEVRRTVVDPKNDGDAGE